MTIQRDKLCFVGSKIKVEKVKSLHACDTAYTNVKRPLGEGGDFLVKCFEQMPHIAHPSWRFTVKINIFEAPRSQAMMRRIEFRTLGFTEHL